MSFVHSRDELVSELLRAMGIVPEKTRRVTMEFGVNAAVVTVVEAYATREDITALTETVRQFKLVPVEELDAEPLVNGHSPEFESLLADAKAELAGD